jgi:hypothetical protein
LHRSALPLTSEPRVPVGTRGSLCLSYNRRRVLGAIEKYFPQMKSGKEYRPITDEELKRTSVYAISIES